MSEKKSSRETTVEILPLKMEANARLIEPMGNLLGFANVRFNGSFVVEDFKILQNSKTNALFVGMPSKPDKKSQSGYKETVYGTKEFRAAINRVVEAAYYAEVERLQTRTATIASHKTSLKEQLGESAEQAEKANAARLAVTKGGQAKNAER